MKEEKETVKGERRIEKKRDANFDARYTGPYSLGLSSDRFQLPAHSITVIEVKPGKRLETLELPITLENTLVTPETHATMVLKAALK